MSLTLLLKFCLPQLYNLDNPSVFAVILMKRKIGLDFHFSPILFFFVANLCKVAVCRFHPTTIFRPELRHTFWLLSEEFPPFTDS